MVRSLLLLVLLPFAHGFVAWFIANGRMYSGQGGNYQISLPVNSSIEILFEFNASTPCGTNLKDVDMSFSDATAADAVFSPPGTGTFMHGSVSGFATAANFTVSTYQLGTRYIDFAFRSCVGSTLGTLRLDLVIFGGQTICEFRAAGGPETARIAYYGSPLTSPPQITLRITQQVGMYQFKFERLCDSTSALYAINTTNSFPSIATLAFTSNSVAPFTRVTAGEVTIPFIVTPLAIGMTRIDFDFLACTTSPIINRLSLFVTVNL